MKKVILIAFYFNQVNEIASKRLRALAKYLPQFGWEPIVIVPDLGFIPKENDDLNCRIICTEYEDMFSHFLNKFNLSKSNNSDDDYAHDNDYSSDLKDNNPELLKDSSSFSNPLASKAVSIAGEVFAYPDGMKYWYGSAFNEASKIIEEEEIDAIISSSWPITCHTIAKDLKDNYGIPWIADLRDLWNLNPYVSHTFIRNYFERKLELKTFENTDVLTTTTDLAGKTLSTLHPKSRIVPIMSGYDEDDLKFLNEIIDSGNEFGNEISNDISTYEEDDLGNESALKDDKLKFIYAGSLYGGKRDPTNLFKAIRQLEDEGNLDSSRLSIEFYGDDTNLNEMASKYGLLDIVKIGGKISHEEVLKKQINSDVLLLISWNDEREKMFIPGKIYEYFALKKPVLSIGYNEGSLKDLIEETGVGYHVSDLESTKEVLLEIYNQFIENGHVEFNSDINIEDYSMVNMANKFADLLNDITTDITK